MLKHCRTMVAGVLSAGLIGGGLFAQESLAEIVDGVQEGSKLVQVTTLEQAFARSLQTRQQLANRVMRLVQVLRAEEDEDKKAEIREELERINRALEGVKVAMEVIFGLGNRREYEYVANTIYLKVGTVEETFTRAVRTRDSLLQYIAQKTEEKDAAEDAETVQQLQNQIDEATRQYQVMAASLQIIFNVVPQRHYTYNPQNATLYLNVTDEEVEQLQERVRELREQQQAGAAAE